MQSLADDIDEVPKALEAQPEIGAGYQWLWSAFWAVHVDRQVGFNGPLPIPFSAIDRLAIRYRIDSVDDFDRLLAVIGIMDATYLKWIDSKRPKEAGS